MAKIKSPQVKSTQSYLRISEVKSDTVIMEDGSYVAILGVSSTNFALKSQEEQNALIAGYQNFLNALDFNIQILMQSRKMEIGSYLEKLKVVMEQQTNELLRVQTAEYIEFISKLIENASIMNKNFYIIIPYTPAVLGAGGAGGAAKRGFLDIFRPRDPNAAAQQLTEKAKDFQEHRQQLEQRINTIIAGLSGLGLKSIPLQTEEIIELLYSSYNIDAGPLIDPGRISELRIKN